MILKTSLLVEEKYTGKSQYEFLHMLQPGDIIDVEFDTNKYYHVPQFKLTSRNTGMEHKTTLGGWKQISYKIKFKEL